MSRIALFTQLQRKLGPEQAQAVAEYVEDARQQQLDGLATKQELRAVELSLIQQIATTEKNLEEKLHNVELRLISKMQQWSVIQFVGTVGTIVALSRLI